MKKSVALLLVLVMALFAVPACAKNLEKEYAAAEELLHMGDFNAAAALAEPMKNAAEMSRRLSTGYYHTVGLRSDRTVMAVGKDSFDQCDITGWSDVVAVSAGVSHTVGLKSDGTVVAVGRNDDGQCGVADWNLLQ